MDTVDDVVAAIRTLSDELARDGSVASAHALDSALQGYYTTSTEALIAIMDALTDSQATLSVEALKKWGDQIRLLTADAKRIAQLH